MQHHNLARLLTLLADDELWKSMGACGSAEADLFFPISLSAGSEAEVAKAKAICAGCLVRRECLDYAIQTRQMHGIWGGMTEEERYPAVRASAALVSHRDQTASAERSLR